MKLREMISWASTGVVLCCAIAALTLPIFGPDSAKKTGELAISLVSAIGTLAAVIVALYLGNKSGSEARASAMLIAEITGNKLYTQICLLFEAVQECLAEIARAHANRSSFEYLPGAIYRGLPHELIVFQHEDLIRMSALPDRCAVRIASIAMSLERLKMDCTEKHGAFALGPVVSPETTVSQWDGCLSHAAEELAIIIDVLNYAHLDERQLRAMARHHHRHTQLLRKIGVGSDRA